MLFVDADNAYGSPSGDVDDAYAIAALLAAKAPVVAIGSCGGNTSAERAYANNVRLAAQFGFRGPVLRASESKEFLRDFTGRVLALGPLTNVVTARNASEIVLIGGNSVSRGRWPPLWPHEFNLTFDKPAARAVFTLDVPLTIFPLNVARQLAIGIDEVPEFLREGTRRWFRHLRLVRFMSRFPVYDLAAALYAMDASDFTFADTTATMRANTHLGFRVEAAVPGRRVTMAAEDGRRHTRPVKLCTSLDRDLLWSRFVRCVDSFFSQRS